METLILVLVLVVVVFVGIFLATGLCGAPYVPSRRKEIREAFTKLKPLGSGDVVVDFGCGDGVVIDEAVKAGAGRAVGIEINPMLALIAKRRFRKNKKIAIKCGDFRFVKLPEDMTVAYVFGIARVMKILKPRLEKYAREYGRDVFVVSLAFEFNGVKPEKEVGAYRLYRIRG